jgi:translation initiation factor 2 alpha subunit (eIF-2alpha)
MENQNALPEQTEKKVRKVNTMPVKQTDLLTLAENVVTKWSATPEITIRWIKFDDFKKLVTQFKEALEQRTEVGSSRQSTTQQLKNLDKTINDLIEEAKIAILGKFGRQDGKSYFNEFGIIKINKAFKFPQDRNQRVQALEILLKGLEKHKIEIAKYSFTSVQVIRDQYVALSKEAQNIDSNVATEVSNKNEAIKQVEKVLNALIQIIKGNYPDTYKSELRAWGFQKEKY